MGSPTVACDKSEEGGCGHQFRVQTIIRHCINIQCKHHHAMFHTIFICKCWVILPYAPRSVFGKPFLDFISMVSLVTHCDLVVVVIELLSSFINCSHIFRLQVDVNMWKIKSVIVLIHLTNRVGVSQYI